MERLRQDMRKLIKSIKVYMESEKLFGIEDFYLPSVSLTKSLGQLRQEVGKCRQCPLCKTRKNPVFGEGNSQAKLVFVGEAPGKDEDLQGLPFVGRAGRLLTKIIEAMKFTREDVFICNVLKCRPPENRNPAPSEIDACRDYLWQQLEIIQPRVVCCLGNIACSLLFNENLAISKIRGKFRELRGIKVMPTFHPAYLLRNPDAKSLVWQDMQKIMAEIKKA